MYYALGQTYLDDNTKKKNTSMKLAQAMSIRMFGQIVAFVLGYFSLKVYIDPTTTPLINDKDPRWLGAWWLGWIILGFSMLFFAGLIGMFPKHLPKKKVMRVSCEAPITAYVDEEIQFRSCEIPYVAGERRVQEEEESPKMKDFPKALIRLLKNKTLMFNILSTIFSILGSSGYITFLSKYMEVQFNKNSADASIVTGPITTIGMVSGFLLSGYVISKYKPGPRKLFFWNVIIGCGYMVGQVVYIFLSCDNNYINNFTGTLNLTAPCNANCSCSEVSYSPVCYEPTLTTFFSPCHAGCNRWDDNGKYYDSCACSMEKRFTKMPSNYSTFSPKSKVIKDLPSTTLPDISTTVVPTSIVNTETSKFIRNATIKDQYEPVSFKAIKSSDYNNENDNYNVADEKVISRQERVLKDNLSFIKKMTPGACLAGCAKGFYLFTIISLIINWLGATGRIGKILLNFRVVMEKDKSMSQGLSLMLISLFAFIPGPIIYGYIIDSSCAIWNYKCGNRGNCQLYNTTQFRYNVNFTAIALTFIEVTFDVLVWYYSKNIDLYGEEEENKLINRVKQSKSISPLLDTKNLNR